MSNLHRVHETQIDLYVFFSFSKEGDIVQNVLTELLDMLQYSKLCFVVYLPTEMEAAVSAPAKHHPVSVGSASRIWTALFLQHHGAVDR